MTEVRRGDIWLVGLDPTIGHETRKSCPCLIIQNNLGNQYSPTTIVAPITSQGLEHVYPVEVLLPRKGTGLQKDSKALLGQIRTVDKQRLAKRLGRVSAEMMTQVDEAVKISLGLINI